jgi:hypothetical protein
VVFLKSLGFKIMNRAYLVANSEAKALLGRFRRKCDDDYDDDIKMNLQEIEWERVEWTCVAQTGKVAKSCEQGKELSGYIKCGVILY